MTTSIKLALRGWEEENKGTIIGRATQVVLSLRRPPIKIMDNGLSSLTSVQHLSLSSNIIENVAGLERLTNLRVLSLARNNLKDLSGIEAVAGSLEQLWVSYNFIEKLKALTGMKKLKILYIGHNAIKDWKEVERLSELPQLHEILLMDNPMSENMDQDKYRDRVARLLPQITSLDGSPVMRDDEIADTDVSEPPQAPA